MWQKIGGRAMQTDDLIAQLSTRLEPVKNGATTHLLLGAVAAGVAGSILVMLTMIGLRHDLNSAMVSFGMWTKLVYTFAIAGFGLWLVERAGRPGAERTRPALMLAPPLLAVALLAVLQMSAPGADMPRLVIGHFHRGCAPLGALTALPPLAA